MAQRNAHPTILTIGHSTRAIEAFIGLLKSHQVQQLVDIRTIPKSRRNPQFHTDALSASLRGAGIEYRHLKDLGGLRHARRDSPNTGWRNASFRGYADYMQTAGFAAALERLIASSAKKRTAIMCAEAVPWRCHRSLVADALTARGIPVEHIFSATRSDLHEPTSFLRVSRDGRLSYPDPAPSLWNDEGPSRQPSHQSLDSRSQRHRDKPSGRASARARSQRKKRARQ